MASNVLIYFSQVLMLPSYRTILVYAESMPKDRVNIQERMSVKVLVFQEIGQNL